MKFCDLCCSVWDKSPAESAGGSGAAALPKGQCTQWLHSPAATPWFQHALRAQKITLQKPADF